MAIIPGTSGNDRLRGTNDADIISGEGGNDHLRGAAGDDSINGGGGNDDIQGGRGDDTLHGGLGADTMTGGRGDDLFTFGSPYAGGGIPMWDGGDTIADFQPGVDKLDFSNLISDKGFDSAFVGAGPFSTDPPIPRDFASFQFIHGDFDSVEVAYRHENGNTIVLFDGPVNIGSARFNPTPMDGNVDGRLTLAGLHTLSADDFIL
jgi:Ca2+-binding RTX toxin-like protein